MNSIENSGREMQKRPDVLILGLPRWEGDYQKSTVELAKELSQFHRVLYVEYTPTWKDTKGPKPGLLRQIHDSLWVLTPPSLLPIHWISSASWYDRCLTWNAKVLRRAILKELNALHFSDLISINAFQPALGTKLLGTLGETKTYYYAYDEMSAAAWLKKHGPRYEEQFLKQVTGAIVSSTGLYQTKKKLQPNIHLITNGVETTLFDQARYPYHPKPILGYIGALDDRLDSPLLQAIAQAFPQHTLQLIGKLTHPPLKEALHDFPNVEWVGAVPPIEIGQYLRHFQVGLIPFLTNPFTRNIYPMKINQYLALGMPVVSTDFADLSSFGNAISVAETIPQFLQSLQAALLDTNPADQKKRTHLAWQNAWPAKAQQLSNLITS